MSAMTVSISSITTTAKTIINILNDLSSSIKIPDIKLSLNKLDLNTKVKIIDALLKEIKYVELDSVNLALISIKEILFNIEYELFRMENRTRYNNSLYVMSYMRSYNLNNHIDKLTEYNSILDVRLKLFFDILNIKNYLTSTKSKDQPPSYTNDKFEEIN